MRLKSPKDEADYAIARCKDFAEQGLDWSDIAVLYRTYDVGRWLAAQFCRAGLPVEWVNRDRRSRHYSPGSSSIKLMTMHASKGLEFPVVLIPAVDLIKCNAESLDSEVRLLYVVMTRAIEWLILTHQRETEIVSKLKSAGCKYIEKV